MRKIIQTILLIVNLIAVVGLLLTYLSPCVNPARFWLPSLWGLFYPYFLVANLILFFLWLPLHWKYSVISLVAILLGFQILNNYFRFSSRRNKDVKGLKVMSYNVHSFPPERNKKQMHYGVLDFIADQDADIVCLQETRLTAKGEISIESLKGRFPKLTFCQFPNLNKGGGPVTFSHYPIVNKGEICFDNTSNMVIFSDIKVNRDTIRVYNCHLQSFKIRHDEYSVLDSISLESKQIDEVRRIGSKLKRGNIIRAGQVQELMKSINRCPYRKIVCGDFNDTPVSYTYHCVTTKLEDSFAGSGSGISKTFRERIASYRIDYIFHDKNFESYNYTRYEVPYSDHYPVSAVLVKE